MSENITFVYRPDGQKILTTDLFRLYHLSQKSPIFGRFNEIDVGSGRFRRSLSHRVVGVEACGVELLLHVEPTPTELGQRLRRLFDECRPLAVIPYLKGSTDDQGKWDWGDAEILSWDVHLLPEKDSELDRIVHDIRRDRHKPTT